MKRTLITQHREISAIALAELLVLLIPFTSMKFNVGGFNWTTRDFIVAGGLVAFFGILYILFTHLATKHRLAIGIVLALVFLYLWAELAVGIFFNWGS